MLYIGAIDSLPEYGRIYSIYLCNVAIKNPRIAGGIQHQLPHVPVTAEVLNVSVIKRIDTTIKPQEFEDGYKEWRSEFDAGRAGVFSISVAEIVSSIEEAVKQANSR